MVQVRPADTNAFLAAPDPAIRVILIFGPDDGLVIERARTFCRTVVGETDDPFSLVQLESNELTDDPGRLADEANSVPLFGGQRAILLRHSGNRSIVPAIEALLDSPPADSWVVITAGELRKDAPLRRLCESAPGAAAIVCYADAARDLDRVIDEEFAEAGLTISPEARALLQNLIGSDRLASRSEVRKLCLYAADASMVEPADVRAVVGDASAFAVDEAVDALALGNVEEFDNSFRQLVASGTPGFVIAGATLRHFSFLHLARATHDQGTSPKQIVARARPPIFYKRQSQVERQIALWPRPRIERALAHLSQSVIESRFRNAISDVVIGQALILVATVATSLRRGRTRN